MGKFSRLGNALYEGEASIDFVGRKWLWYSISAVFLAIAIFGLTVRGLNLGVEFQGGVELSVPVGADSANQSGVDKVRKAIVGTGLDAASSPVVNVQGTDAIRATTEPLDNDTTDQVLSAISQATGVKATEISVNEVGPSWGQQVAKRATTGLVVFLVLVVLFIWAYFRQWKMSVAGLVALAHDVLITVGVYALSGFEVTPATVTGVLTILGFSLYDTVVVFDKIRENTKNLRTSRTTYAKAANLAVNQTLVRSINTSVVALLPVAAILYVGIATLGSGALKDLALSLFIGMAAGAYSSIFIAPPLLVQLKSGEKEVEDAIRREQKRARREADRYAAVPAFTEDMPIHDEPDQVGSAGVDNVDHVGEEVAVRAPRRQEALGSGRIVPEAKGPVAESKSAGRAQPTRQPRSKRGKK